MNKFYQKQLLKYSRKDLIASCILFENNLYLQSIYMFQQSVEKAVKNYGLLTGIVSINDLQWKIGHNPIKLFEIFLHFNEKNVKRLENARKDKIIGKANFFQDFDMSKGFENFHKAKQEINKLKKTEVQKNKNLLIDIFNNLLDINRGIERLKKTSLKAEFIRNCFDKGLEYSKDLLQRLSPFNAKKIKLEIDYFMKKEVSKNKTIRKVAKLLRLLLFAIMIEQALIHLSVLVIKLDTRLRYPSDSNSLLNTLTKKDTFIRMLPDFQDQLLLIINHLEKFNFQLALVKTP
ncbi:MAG: HEPN domain-containing protein [Chlorobi bacterium]|nr:HEPN domain-containing protein [Chlorobiota bacterium]MCI0716929.1 HEPN domain-containing protein [Chlorobiota bacterium]